MGTYYIPRNVKGESRILYIFSVKSLITTGIGAIIGLPLFLILKSTAGLIPALIEIIIFGGLGFAVGAVKIPRLAGIPFTKNIAGDSIDEIILRYIKFKKGRKIYINTKEEEDNGNS